MVEDHRQYNAESGDCHGADRASEVRKVAKISTPADGAGQDIPCSPRFVNASFGESEVQKVAKISTPADLT